ncbi:unnamed protein product [Allacma fusca]|uniref:Uncharacterized protein n=1 Tax=Allacma fusca TaxID=39272 RepID=A0A8J2JSQ4_9HEXA|nr:unnamed protein product [Allacma fusca]
MPLLLFKKSFKNVVLLPRFSKALLFLGLSFLLFVVSISFFQENVLGLQGQGSQLKESISSKTKSKILCYVLISPRKISKSGHPSDLFKCQ